MTTAEHTRLTQADRDGVPWRRWGPYLSDRQWGTVREDTSPDGDAWNAFPHDHARSRAYRWGEDGLLGWSDDQQRLCLALALWNGTDPILKERLFGLTNGEGNHGEDVKEYYFFSDATPTHSWMRALYKYPQAAFPYDDLVATNAARGRQDLEYELVDTGVFDQHRYFDVEVVYAKLAPDDVVMQVTATNRGPDPAPLHLLPTVWLRNTWWADPQASRPSLTADPDARRITVDCPGLGRQHLAWDRPAEVLVTDNETNAARLGLGDNPTPFVKDGINDAVVAGRSGSVNPELTGTKAAVWLTVELAAGQTTVLRLRLAPQLPDGDAIFGEAVDRALADRQAEADDFHAAITPPGVDADAAAVMRQALAGMLWSKQFYCYDLDRWLADRGLHPLRDEVGLDRRNARWFHLVAGDVISMPDCWEYPWFAAWDLAFHTMTLAMVDPTFAREQIRLLLGERYLHPTGQIPAYEWNFSDVNPPVHAMAAMFAHLGAPDGGDHDFLSDVFTRLLMNFTWWVNQKDPGGANAFEGGFLGLDNIAAFDRSAAQLPGGGRLEQADGTGWMALYAQTMLELALELADNDPAHEGMALKFLEHFFAIAATIERGEGMWDEADGFFYDQLRLPDGTTRRLQVRSMVGLLPLCAVTLLPPSLADRYPSLLGRIEEYLGRHPDLLAGIAHPLAEGVGGKRMLSVLSEDRLRRVLAHLLDEGEFLSPHGIRALSRHHADHPYTIDLDGQTFTVGYLPAESDSGLFGGNSNWRGPVWLPVNFMIIRALLQYHQFHGDDFTVELPTGSGNQVTLFEVARDLAARLTGIFTRDGDGRRPVFGGTELFQTDPHWRDHLLFYEYFHGDNGAGLGASHQTGWTGLVAKLIQLFATLEPAEVLASSDTHPATRLYQRDAAG